MENFKKLKFNDFKNLNELTKSCTSFYIYSIHYDDKYKPSIYDILNNDSYLLICDEFNFNIINGNHNIVFYKNINKYEKIGYTFALNKDSMCIFDLYYDIIDTKFIFISYSKTNNINKDYEKEKKNINENDLIINEL